MPIRATCTCGKSVQAKDELAGKRVKCPGCGQPLVIPMPGGAPMPAHGAAAMPAQGPAAGYGAPGMAAAGAGYPAMEGGYPGMTMPGAAPMGMPGAAADPFASLAGFAGAFCGGGINGVFGFWLGSKPIGAGPLTVHIALKTSSETF